MVRAWVSLVILGLALSGIAAVAHAQGEPDSARTAIDDARLEDALLEGEIEAGEIEGATPPAAGERDGDARGARGRFLRTRCCASQRARRSCV